MILIEKPPYGGLSIPSMLARANTQARARAESKACLIFASCIFQGLIDINIEEFVFCPFGDFAHTGIPLL
jgi:hypothetical protein